MTKPIKDPKYSRPFDVHVWSEHPEVNNFINQVYALLPAEVIGRVESKSNNKGTLPKHLLKVVLIDLFVAWKQDPELCIGINLANAAYKVGSRYNGLHLSKKLPIMVHALRELGLLDWENHSHSKTNPKGNRTTRIRASDQLQEMFAQAALKEDWIRFNEKREVLILRDKDQLDPGQDSFDKEGRKKVKQSKNIEYEDFELPSYLKGAKETLRAYNELLNRSHIDVANLDHPSFCRTDDDGKSVNVPIHQGRHFIRRIFSRGSFQCNGRFYGSWWQNCPKHYRKFIRINGQPTVEIDYSAMHPMILAAEKGLAIEGDPYILARPISNEIDSKTQRGLVKAFVLTAINAANSDQAYRAFLHKFSGEFEVSLTKNLFNRLHQGFIETHPQLEDCLFSDLGIRLMNIDSQIANRIVSAFVCFQQPILTVHDSFIVPVKDVAQMEFMMEMASEAELGTRLKFKRDKHFLSIDQLPPQHLDRDAHFQSFEYFVETYSASRAYKQRWDEWQEAQPLH